MKFLGLILAAAFAVLPSLAFAEGCHGSESAQISCPDGQDWDRGTRSCVPSVNT
ncbi:hypothetical protein [Aliiroseovarius sp. YM-037]|uniref:hypothetical protein n=1 Tax=Aliiroseovarius sp. YM-037 TaxID=3341728 RepID=UPI003A8099A6